MNDEDSSEFGAQRIKKIRKVVIDKRKKSTPHSSLLYSCTILFGSTLNGQQ
jgi:hypothetical protein